LGATEGGFTGQLATLISDGNEGGPLWGAGAGAAHAEPAAAADRQESGIRIGIVRHVRVQARAELCQRGGDAGLGLVPGQGLVLAETAPAAAEQPAVAAVAPTGLRREGARRGQSQRGTAYAEYVG